MTLVSVNIGNNKILNNGYKIIVCTRDSVAKKMSLFVRAHATFNNHNSKL